MPSLTVTVVPESLDQVHDLLDRVWRERSDVTPDERDRFALAVVEIVGNVAEHSAGTGLAAPTMRLDVNVSAEQITGAIRDDGSAVVAPHNTTMPEEFSEHGRGLALAHAALDELHYERRADHNVWRLVLTRQGSMRWGTTANFAAVYEELMVPAFFTTFADAMLERGAPRAGQSMLDVATGTGIVLRRAYARCPEAHRLIGVDLTPDMLAVGREVAAGTPIEFVLGDAGGLSFDTNTFDLLTCAQGLQFFSAREQALGEFRRVLVPGGQVVVACWADVTAAYAHATLTEVVREVAPQLEAVALAPYALSGARELAALIERAGFADVVVERVEKTARFGPPESYTRSFMEGSPMAVAANALDPDTRSALTDAITARVRQRFGERVDAPMVSHIATGRA